MINKDEYSWIILLYAGVNENQWLNIFNSLNILVCWKQKKKKKKKKKKNTNSFAHESFKAYFQINSKLRQAKGRIVKTAKHNILNTPS